MEFGHITPMMEPAVAAQPVFLASPKSTTASVSKKGLIKTILKRHGRDTVTKCTNNFMEAFDRMQEKDKRDDEPESISDMDVGSAAAGTASRWWQEAWPSIKQKLNSQTTQRERMFGLQAERMNAGEARLEQEA